VRTRLLLPLLAALCAGAPGWTGTASADRQPPDEADRVFIQPVVPIDPTRGLDRQGLLHLLATTNVWPDLRQAAIEALRRKVSGTGSVLIERLPDFPMHRVELAQFIFATQTRVAAEPAREWLRSAEAPLRFWGALTLVRDGRRADNEGLPELTALLQQDDDLRFYPDAIDTLLARKDEPALALACGILKKPKVGTDVHCEAILFQLMLTGRPEALDYLLARLDDPRAMGEIRGLWGGSEVTRRVLAADGFAHLLSEWRTDHWQPDSPLAPDADRARQREELKTWLKDTFAKIRESRPVPLRTLKGVRAGEGKPLPVP